MVKVDGKTVLRGAGTQPLRTYVDRIQAAVAEWVSLRPIFDVCARDVGYEGGGDYVCRGGVRRQRRIS